MHELIASPFLDGYLALRPGRQAGLRLPEHKYQELQAVVRADALPPAWFAEEARKIWGLDIRDRSARSTLLVREPSDYGFSRASWEINLGCNFDCPHCYLATKKFAGLSWEQKVRLLDIMRDAGVLWLQITGGEPTIDRDFPGAYRYAYSQGMMLTVSTNASRLWNRDVLRLFRDCPPYRIVVSMYGATEETFDQFTRRRGAWNTFKRGIDAGRAAGLPLRLNLIVTNETSHEADPMAALAEAWGIPHHAYTNMTPTIYGGGESLLAQSTEHLRERKPFTGCNAGVTFFHADPHGRVSICKVGRDDQIDLMSEGIEGLRRLPGISDKLMLRTGGCEGCALSGSCRVCRPLAKQYQEAKAPLASYCQHGQSKKEMVKT
ncbi:radical SAM protein [Streptomyces sp. VNUA116]|uniref:radical SAM protein n=1 Tax=Streptomyces sp. VNUA116 TaxID=3062449 RepID=UPI0026745DF4|nr:radical SAM protein [Streptomyces sp. VNUA116]WKU46710.1 radical SAM protein [Streptomyces sp. VNUA116]